MKTELNSIKQFRAAWLLLGVGILLSFACKQATGSFDTSEEVVIEELNINVKYAESYDQTVTTYSRLWPEGISAGFGKGKINEGGELLVDYERTREVLAFDEDGYMSTVSEFLEGDGEMNMPEEAFNDLKDVMPARANDYDPVVKTVMEGGAKTSFGKSGNIISQHTYDDEEFRLEPALLDSLNKYQSEPESTDNSIKRNLLQLQDKGVDYEIINDVYAKYTVKPSLEVDDNGFGKLIMVKDLRTGSIVSSAILKADGNYDSITSTRFSVVEGVPILVAEEVLSFGKINGGWGITTRTITKRNNIKVYKNNGERK